MRIILCGLLACGLCGCVKVKQDGDGAAQKNESKTNQSQRRSPGGVAGLVLPVDENDTRPRSNGGNNPPPQNNQYIPMVQSRIVEWPKHGKENPNVVPVDTKVDGWDPYSTAASAYVNIPARVEALTSQYNARLQSQINAIDGGNKKAGPLSFDEFVEDFQKSGRKFKNQRPYRLYGYNPKTGKVIVLEDKALKKKIYKEKGIPWDE